MSIENPNFLKEKYGLHNSEEVEKAVERTERRTGESVPKNPADRIQNYLDRFNEILDRDDPEKQERGVEALKRVLHRQFVIKPEEIPEGYFENQRRIAREQGHGEIEITNEMREQSAEVIVADQENTLDNWVDYLASPDAPYPDWLKYYATRSILGMGEFDKEKKQFTKRSKGTTKPFPDLNREALAYVLDAIEKKQAGIETVVGPHPETEEEEVKKFEKLLQGENFTKLYAWAIEKVTPAAVEQLTITEGQWVKYEKGSDHMPLVESLQGHGTGWCTAGESTAEAQLKTGDFYVYYSLDQAGKPSVPRAAIRMQEDSIAEVRGIAPEQNLDPYIGEVVQEKLKEFPDGQQYEKKAEDMKLLTALESKIKSGQELTKNDLTFLYEINAPIEGFGFKRDPRLVELRSQRDREQDMLIVFECKPEQIAHSVSEISEDTKAYVGKLEHGIFQKLPGNFEHLYTSFPEGKIRRENIEIGDKKIKQLLRELKQAEINIERYARDILTNRDFIVGKKVGNITLVHLSVADLGFTEYTTTTQQIYNRAEELGLELCPAEVGPHYRLKYKNQPRNEDIYIGMWPIVASDGRPYVFEVEYLGETLRLNSSMAHGFSHRFIDDKLVFRLGESTQQNYFGRWGILY